MNGEALPDEFLEHARALERAYLATNDPIRQSGFTGGAARWRAEREPILNAIDRDGDLLDIGCANGYLLECLIRWGAERGLELSPHGLDLSERLIQLARQRHPSFSHQFHVGDAWNWRPPRTYRFVYSVWDCVPEPYLGEYIARLLDRTVEPGGTLIIGMYGSRSRSIAPIDLRARLLDLGFNVLGAAQGGAPPVSSFAWMRRDEAT